MPGIALVRKKIINKEKINASLNLKGNETQKIYYKDFYMVASFREDATYVSSLNEYDDKIILVHGQLDYKDFLSINISNLNLMNFIHFLVIM